MGIIDISGQRCGRLTAIEYTGRKTKPGGNAIWLFRCDCGNYVERPRSMLKYSKTPSCGCYVRERMGNLNKTHGGRNDRLYLVWMDMRRRCSDKKDKNYFRYGGRGITVCDEWQDYAVFKQWAMSSGYDPTAKHLVCTIDRIDTNGNYCPENCRWVDAKAQNNNRRTNKLIDYRGKTQTLKQWSEELGLNYSLVCKRLSAGWDLERAFFQPARVTKRKVVHGLTPLNISPSEKRA